MQVEKESLNGQMTRIVSTLVKSGVSLELARREFERQFIVEALRESEGNFTHAARGIGVHRNTLHNKVGALGIVAADYAPRPKRRSTRRRP